MKYRPRTKENNPRKQQIVSIKEAIEEMFSALKLDDKYYEAKAIEAWNIIMGSTVAKRTASVNIFKGKMTIKLSSAPLKSELNTSRELIRTKLNQYLGKEVVKILIIQ
ncbi:MAG: DUF721 domain-containing protein [Flammeovirgaceae bacterium]